MGESRSELLAWLNELLQINYTKIEQCGTGAAYCQILDSIYRASNRTTLPPLSCIPPLTCISHVVDIPMTRVKMNARHEYEFIANFKVMQNVFKAKRIDKVLSLSLPSSFPVPLENKKNTPLLTSSTLQLYSLSPWKS
jgi:RP/EB family microtubule-associated protein